MRKALDALRALGCWLTGQPSYQAVSTVRPKFEDLDAMIGGTFHQDWAMDGETLEEVIGVFKRESAPEYQKAVNEDIRNYLAEHPDDVELEQHFYQTFQPDLVEGTFGTAREFLSKIAELLAASG